MKKLSTLIVCLVTATGFVFSALNAAQEISKETNANIRIGVVNFRQVVEQSKMGKHEQQEFDNMRRQMETIMVDEEKKFNEMTTKLSDANYLDSLSPEAEAELKKQYREMGQKISQLQSQYYQALNQINAKTIQKLAEAVSQAATVAAKNLNLDLILSEDATFFHAKARNVTEEVIKVLDELLAANQLKNSSDKDAQKSNLPALSK